MIKPTRLAYLVLAAALAACDAAPASSATAQALTDTTVLPATGWGDSGVTWTSSSDGSVSWCCTNWYVPLPLGVGESVGSISTTVRDNGTANGFGSSSNNVIIVLVAQSSSGSTVLGSVSTDGSGNLQSKTLTLASPHTVASGESLVVKAVALAGGAFPGPASHPSLIKAITIHPSIAPATIIKRFRPQWLQQGPFVISANPTPGNTSPPVWKSTGTVPADASFEIPFQAGDTITALGWDAYGDGGSGIGSIDVLYSSTMGGVDVGGTTTQPAGTFDMNRAPQWGHVTVTPFTPQLLGQSGVLWVSLEIDADNYYIGDVTATFAR